MYQKTIKILSEIPSWLKLASAILITIFSLGGGVIAMEDRYVSEKEAAQSLTMFNQKMVQDFQMMDVKILNLQYTGLTDQYYRLKSMLRQDPNNIELQEDFERVKNEREDVRVKIDKIME